MEDQRNRDRIGQPITIPAPMADYIRTYHARREAAEARWNAAADDPLRKGEAATWAEVASAHEANLARCVGIILSAKAEEG